MRILQYAFRNIIRNPFLSLSSIFVIGLLIFFVNVLIFVLFASEHFIADVQSRIKFTINYQSGYTVDSLRSRELIDALGTGFPGIIVTPITRDASYAHYKILYPDLITIIEGTGENPFPDSLSIAQVPLDRYTDFDALILQYRDLFHYDADILGKKLLDYKSQFSRITSVVMSLHVFEYGVFALLALFAFTVATIIYNVISNSLLFHEKEIEIIELVGGRRSFTYGQFLLQWTFYGLIGMLFVTSLFLVIRSYMGDILGTPDSSIFEKTVSTFFQEFPLLMTMEFLMTLILSLLSAFIALQKHMRKTMIF